MDFFANFYSQTLVPLWATYKTKTFIDNVYFRDFYNFLQFSNFGL
jgi:hypothetical protein